MFAEEMEAAMPEKTSMCGEKIHLFDMSSHFERAQKNSPCNGGLSADRRGGLAQ
jgi:hypothetical protein